MSIGFAIFSYRRVKELSIEMKARRVAELEAKKLARHDPLTGLPNRRFFVETLGEVLLTTNSDSRSAVLMLDLDGFKSINDAYGHAVGDQALIELASEFLLSCGRARFSSALAATNLPSSSRISSRSTI